METFAEELRELVEKWLGFLSTSEAEIIDAMLDELDRLEPDDD